MNLTYEDLKPHLTKENRLWTEDDATMHCEGHESVFRAWPRLFKEEKQEPEEAALIRFDHGDGGCDVFPKGRIYCWAFDGGQIYQLPYDAMVALGLNSAADDLRAALGEDATTPTPGVARSHRACIQDPYFQIAKSNQIRDITDLCHGLSSEAGWWEGVQRPNVPVPEINTKLLLIVTEIAEATEGVRKDLMDDKLPHRKMVEVELADALIRICDLAGAMGLDLGGAVAEKLLFNATREDHKLEVRAAEGGKKF